MYWFFKISNKVQSIEQILEINLTFTKTPFIQKSLFI